MIQVQFTQHAFGIARIATFALWRTINNWNVWHDAILAVLAAPSLGYIYWLLKVKGPVHREWFHILVSL